MSLSQLQILVVVLSFFLFCHSNCFRHFFFNRIARLWNTLPYIDLDASFDIIKRKFWTIFWNHFLVNFDCCNVCSFHLFCPCSSCCNEELTPNNHLTKEERETHTKSQTNKQNENHHMPIIN